MTETTNLFLCDVLPLLIFIEQCECYKFDIGTLYGPIMNECCMNENQTNPDGRYMREKIIILKHFQNVKI